MSTAIDKHGRNRKAIIDWLAALESGKYHQAQSVLRRKNGRKFEYCCLGVACEVRAAHVGGYWQDDASTQDGYPIYEFVADFEPAPDWVGEDVQQAIGSETSLPRPLRDWFGITDEEHGALIGMNDNANATFKEIAQFIRENILDRPRNYFTTQDYE